MRKKVKDNSDITLEALKTADFALSFTASLNNTLNPAASTLPVENPRYTFRLSFRLNAVTAHQLFI